MYGIEGGRDMGTVILSCSSLQAYVEAAQAKQGTDYPVIYIVNIMRIQRL